MIVSANCSGQMCNNIYYFVNTLATALELQHDFTSLFSQSILRFSDTHPDAIKGISIRCLNLPFRKIVDGVHGLLCRLPGQREKDYVTNRTARLERLRRFHRLFPVILWNWNFRNPAAVAKHRDEICRYLKIKDSFCQRGATVVSKARETSGTVVGVHFRRGDYRDVENGNWCFSDEDFAKFMRDFIQSHGSGKSVAFVIVSNEPVNANFFSQQGFNVFVASGRPEEDIYTLSLCDYIMGPPSSFSWFASYYGNKPRLRIFDRNRTVSVADFSRNCPM